jgi:hypothetical protein
MKTIIILIGLSIVPGVVSAKTICNVTEFPEYYEVVCIGDEKAVPSQDTSSAKSGSQNIDASSTNVKKGPDRKAASSSAMTNQTFTMSPATNSTTAGTYRSAQQTTATSPQTMVIPKSSLPAETAQKTATASIPSTDASFAIVHRQGRQQYSRALQDAIAARLQLISP